MPCYFNVLCLLKKGRTLLPIHKLFICGDDVMRSSGSALQGDGDETQKHKNMEANGQCVVLSA